MRVATRTNKCVSSKTIRSPHHVLHAFPRKIKVHLCMWNSDEEAAVGLYFTTITLLFNVLLKCFHHHTIIPHYCLLIIEVRTLNKRCTWCNLQRGFKKHKPLFIQVLSIKDEGTAYMSVVLLRIDKLNQTITIARIFYMEIKEIEINEKWQFFS